MASLVTLTDERVFEVDHSLDQIDLMLRDAIGDFSPLVVFELLTEDDYEDRIGINPDLVATVESLEV